jgi:large-conductance mechanosensitive channel
VGNIVGVAVGSIVGVLVGSIVGVCVGNIVVSTSRSVVKIAVVSTD